MNIPSNYRILFTAGGASLQNACVPLNLLGDKTTANYITTGFWSTASINEARKYCTPTESATTKESDFTSFPPPSDWNIDPNGAYLHFCTNETIGGVE
jgi:phosphoserine aminotransferase